MKDFRQNVENEKVHFIPRNKMCRFKVETAVFNSQIA